MLKNSLYKIGFKEKELVDLMCSIGEIERVKNGTSITQEGKYIKQIHILIEGEIRVWKNSQEGKQILLYYMDTGQICPMSLNAIIKQKTITIESVATEDSLVLSLPIEVLHKWMIYKEWSDFILQAITSSYEEITELYSELAFKKLDQRIECFLNGIAKKQKTKNIEMSHSFIAKEMGTSREVVSRVLKHMELEKKVKLGVKKIELIAPV